ncbi:MAG: sugar ABC transporter substrate-binding protein [Firmicutes bacterium]|nr:sugar ABC transporter substrate-binding protein [Bacillota bacterium]
MLRRLLLVVLILLVAAAPALAAPATEANIDWRQAEGASIIVAMNLHMETDELDAQLAEFEELTGIRVNFQIYPEIELHQKTLVDLASGAGIFDVIMMDFMFTPQYAAAKFIEPLGPYLNDPSLTDADWFKASDFMPALWDAVSYNNEVYALPFTVETTTLFYRPDIYADLGLAVPNNYDELWHAAEAIHANKSMDAIGLRGMRGQGMNVYVFAGFMRGFGGKFVADFPNDMTPVINSPENIAAADYYARILQEFGPRGVASWDWLEVLSGLQEGTIAMAIDASNFGPVIDDYSTSRTAGKWGYALVPEGPGGRHPSIYTHTLAINAASRQKTAAWLFIQWATSEDVQIERALRSGQPTRQSIWDSAAFREAMAHVGNGQWIDASVRSLDIVSADYRPRFEHWRQFGDQVGIALQSVIAKEQSAESAFNAAQKAIEELMRSAGYIK